MANISDAFTVENGISFNDQVGIFYGSNDPSVTGEAAPMGSLYLRTTGKLYVKDDTADTAWKQAGEGAGADGATGLIPLSLIKKSTAYVGIPLTYTSIAFDVIELETKTTMIARDTTNTHLVNILQSGTYKITFTGVFSDDGMVRIVKNANAALTVLETSANFGDIATSTTNNGYSANVFVIVSLTAGETVSAQIKSDDGNATLSAGAKFEVMSMSGAKGDTGAAGTGAINVEDGGVPLAGTYSTINFTGPQVSVQNIGGEATVTVNPFGAHYASGVSTAESTTTSITPLTKVSAITAATATAGLYKISFFYTIRCSVTTRAAVTRINIDGTTFIEVGRTILNSATTTNRYPQSGFVLANLTAGSHNISLQFNAATAGDTVGISNAYVEAYRVT